MNQNRRYKIKDSLFSLAFPILTIIGIAILCIFSSFYEKNWSYNWNGIRQTIKDSIKASEYKTLSNRWIGIAQKKSKQYDRRIWIMENATISELQKLIDYPNGTIKAIAYEGLLRKPEFNDKLNLVLKAIDDTEYSIYFVSGCEGIPMNIGEYLVDFVLLISDKGPFPPAGINNRFNFSESDINKILSKYHKVPSLYKVGF